MNPNNDTQVGTPIDSLKQCPFCGGARIVKGERYFAMCVDCGATGPERNGESQSKAFKDWNTRVDDLNLLPLRSQLTQANAELQECRKDKERLDWLDKHIKSNCLSSANEITFLVTYLGKPEINTSRAAISVAMDMKG